MYFQCQGRPAGGASFSDLRFEEENRKRSRRLLEGMYLCVREKRSLRLLEESNIMCWEKKACDFVVAGCVLTRGNGALDISLLLSTLGKEGRNPCFVWIDAVDKKKLNQKLLQPLCVCSVRN